MKSVAEKEIFLGLGGNLADPLAAFRQVRDDLEANPEVSCCRSSALYQTPAVGGPPGQPDYLNAALRCHTTLSAHELLACCQQMEDRAGRQRVEHWGPRTLDIDLLLYDKELIDDPHLTIPHPRLDSRHFVLLPLVDLAPDLEHPGLGLSLQELLDRLPPAEGIRLITRNW